LFLSDVEFGKGSDYAELLRVKEVVETLGITSAGITSASASLTFAEFKRKKL